MIDFEWYRSFLAIYRIGTVTGAAEERGLTQPAVTQHLAALEAAVGAPLFARAGRRMLPTERGKALYTQTAQAVETLEQVSQRLRRRPQETRPLIRLGTPREYFAEVALARLAAMHLSIQVQFGTARTLLDTLQRDDLDLVIATERINLRAIEYRKLAEEHFILVCSAQMQPPIVQPETAEQRATLAGWLLKQAWLSYGSDLPIIRRFWRQLLTQRPAIEPVLVIPDLVVIAKAVTLGYGVSVLPDYLCAQAIRDGLLRAIWTPAPAVTNDLWLAYRVRDRQRPEVVEAITGLQPAHP